MVAPSRGADGCGSRLKIYFIAPLTPSSGTPGYLDCSRDACVARFLPIERAGGDAGVAATGNVRARTGFGISRLALETPAMAELHLLSPRGFRAAGVHAGIKTTRGAPDVGLLVCDAPATAAAVFTTNKVFAAPVAVGRKN